MRVAHLTNNDEAAGGRDACGAGRLNALAQPEEGQDREDDHDEADEINNIIHTYLLCVVQGRHRAYHHEALHTQASAIHTQARMRACGLMRASPSARRRFLSVSMCLAGLASRTDGMLLFLRPLSATLAYIPGPRVPMLVPLKSSSSKNSQVLDEIFIIEGDDLGDVAGRAHRLPGGRERPTHVCHDQQQGSRHAEHDLGHTEHPFTPRHASSRMPPSSVASMRRNCRGAPGACRDPIKMRARVSSAVGDVSHRAAPADSAPGTACPRRGRGRDRPRGSARTRPALAYTPGAGATERGGMSGTTLGG
jgi:hypothetical protein